MSRLTRAPVTHSGTMRRPESYGPSERRSCTNSVHEDLGDETKNADQRIHGAHLRMHLNARLYVTDMLRAAGFFSGFVGLWQTLEQFISFFHQLPMCPDSIDRDRFQVRGR
ncbi:hypothetical protein AGR4C_pc30064 [Agrobacterium tumefaciens str. Kerr 14]|uniref:Uncharacterized protein n=1 Tax=Agrobacterium tumefaciens str. Kerr 14 TaxID=1183424 RepID=A0A1S7SFY2_AGRTU|nr:hypothetical protein AGR4C_pc30064 [Agrobacterium tumefaciens str. Kerr 14]